MKRTVLASSRLKIETLEARENPATFTVTSTSDLNISSAGVVNASGQITNQGNAITLRSAIMAANANGATADTIILGAGTYAVSFTGTEILTDARLNDLDITASGLTIQGATAATTIIQASTTFANRIFDVNTSDSANFTFAMSNLTVDRGSGGSDGAGMRTGNSSSNAITLTNVNFNNNTLTGSDDNGGAIYHQGGTLTISGGTFTNNIVSGNNTIGGAIASTDGTVSVSNATFSGNEAEDFGGAIYIDSGTLTVTGSTFTNNATNDGSGQGGAIAATDTVSITNSSFTSNTSSDGGGAIYLSGTMVGASSIQRNAFVTNSITDGTNGRGGAIRLNNTLPGGATLAISFNRFVGNTSANTNNGTAVAVTANQTVDVLNNWWGTNTPAATDLVAQGGGTLNRSTWLQLRHTANPTTINTGGVSTLTADLLGVANAGGVLAPTAASNLVGLPNFTSTFNAAVLGALSGASANFVNGIATATYTAGVTGGTGSANAVADNQTVTANITINSATQAPAITSANNATFVVGTNTTFTFTATGTPAAGITLTGTVPSGLTFTGGSGSATLSGTPAAGTAGTYSFTVTANNGVGAPATQTFTLTINAAAAITSANNTTFVIGTNSTFTYTATGNPTPTITYDGSILPSGLTFTSGNGTATLSGTPATGTGGTYTFTVTATNGVGTPATQSFSLTITAAPVAPAITSANSTGFTVGTLSNFSFTATGTPTPTITLSGPPVPSGLTFVTGTGTATLSGTPATGTAGTYTFTVTATNGVGVPATQTFTLNIGNPLVAPTFTSAGTTTFTRGTPGSFSVTTSASNPANPTISFINGTLPIGVTLLDIGNGTATLNYDGNPSTPTGLAEFDLTATNGVIPAGSQAFDLTINPEVTIAPAALAVGTVTAAYNASITSSGGTGAVSLAVSNVQNPITGLNIPVGGIGAFTINGTPTTSGTVTFTVTATDSIGAVTVKNYSITVNTAVLFAPLNLPDGSFNAPYTTTIDLTGGTLPYTSVQVLNLTANGTGLTAGNFTFGATGATLNFTPTGSGTATFTISVTDTAGATFTNNYSLLVTPDTLPPTVTISNPSALYTNTAPVTYTVTFNDPNFGSALLTTSNVFLTTTGTATATVSVTPQSSNTFLVTLNNITGDGTLSISVGSGASIDLAGNESPAAGISTPVTVDNTLPAITISPPSLAATNNTDVTYTVTYTDDNFNTATLDVGDLLLNSTASANGTLSVAQQNSTTYLVTISNITGEGTLGFSIAANTATDLAGNQAAGATSTGVLVDDTLPVTSIGAPTTSIIKSGPTSFTITYTDTNFANATLTLNDITVTKTGTADGTLVLTPVNATTYTVDIINATGDGTLSISVPSGTATDTAGNLATAAGPSAVVIVDNTAPSITISGPSASVTQTGQVTYTITYTDANFDVAQLLSSDFNFTTTGTANGQFGLQQLNAFTYEASFFNLTGDGTVGFTINAGTAIDLAGNLALASAASPTFAIDNTVPTITIGTPSVSLTQGGPVTYSVTYTGTDNNAPTLSIGDLSLIGTGTTGTLSLQQLTTTTYEVTISGITGDGTIGFAIAANTAVDDVGNQATAAASATVVVDNTAPTVNITAPTPSITATGPITYTVSYTGADASTLTLANLSLTGVGTTGTLGLTPLGNNTYTVTISNITGNGTVGFDIVAGTASDLAGNLAAAASSTTATVDNTIPTINISAPVPSITATNAITYTVSYSDANLDTSTLSLGDLSLNAVGTSGTLSLTPLGNNTYTVTISNIAGDGTIGFSIAAGTASDLAGNLAPAATSTTAIVDNTAPTVSISAPTPNITGTNAVSYTVSYADANFNTSTLTLGNLSLNAVGTTGTLSLTPLGNNTFTVTISNITGNGTIGFSIAAGTASDLAGNLAAAATSSTAIVDNTAPTVNITTPSSSITKNGPLTYTVSYADANFNTSTLTLANLSLNAVGTTGTLGLTPLGNNTYTVTISNITGNGTIGFSIAAGTASDLAGNLAPAATSTTAIVDNTAPTVNITGPSIAITKNGPITYTVSYSDANFNTSTLTLANLSLNAVGTSGTLSLTPLGNNTYTVAISNITGNGTIGFSIVAGTASDLAGNLAPAATSTTAIVDNTAPVLTISAPSVSSTTAGPISYTVTVNDANPAPFTLTAAQITLTKTNAKLSGTVTVTPVNATTYTVTISDITGGKGKLGIQIPAGAVSDLAGNTSAGPVNGTQANITGTRVLRVSNLGIPSYVDVGSTKTFTVNFRNIGNQTAKNAVVFVTLPAYATLDTLGSDPGWTLVSGKRYRLNVGDMAAGANGQALLALTFSKPPKPGFKVSLTSVLTDDQSNGKSAHSAVSHFTIGKASSTRVRW